MIPRAVITEWRNNAPWKANEQVEQDLLISRALVELFTNPFFAENYAFRGGTALHKLYMQPQVRYSEDIDLIQIIPAKIGPAIKHIRKVIEPVMGKPLAVKQKKRNNTIVFVADSEIPPVMKMKLKIEINCREHLSVFGFKHENFSVQSRWFSGTSRITTFTIEELLGSKLRALFQRKKGRDLFDLWYGLTEGDASSDLIVEAFYKYMEFVNCKVSKKNYLSNLKAKINDSDFRSDINPLLRPEIDYNIDSAYSHIKKELISLLI